MEKALEIIFYIILFASLITICVIAIKGWIEICDAFTEARAKAERENIKQAIRELNKED